MKSNNFKKIILYVFASTGAVLFLLAIFAMFKGNEAISANTILEITGANVIISIGLSLTHKIEFRYAIFEFLLDIGFMIIVIVLSGVLFDWYSKIPVWVPLAIVFLIYILFYLLDIVRVQRDIKEINKMLQKLKDKEASSAS